MSQLSYRHTYKRNLPHIQPPGATLFVTFRLVGSLPKYVVETLREELKLTTTKIRTTKNAAESETERYKAQRHYFGRWDTALDKAEYGPLWLKEPDIAKIIVDCLHHLNRTIYSLIAYCVMANHVHVVFTPLEKSDGSYHALTQIMHSLKLYTAREANSVLGRKGQFWQRESYDHIVRDEAELNRVVQYVINNPVKAGLVETWADWPWTYSVYEQKD